VVRAGQVQGKGSIVSGVQKKFEPLLAHLTHLIIIKNGLEMRNSPQSKEGQELKKQITKHYKG
jgi:hypothetical protein